MTKLLYILPEYKKDAHTHFSYIPTFLERLSSSLDVTLLVERGDIPVLAHIQSGRAGFFPILMARFKGHRRAYVHYSFKSAFFASVIFRSSGGTVFYWNCGLPWQYRRSFFREIFERLVYRMVSFVVTGTEGIADQYAKKYNISRQRVRVMPNWIDVGATREEGGGRREEIRAELGIQKGQKMVLFAHRLSPRKGAQYLPEIAKTLPADVALVIAGDGPLRGSLEGRAKREEWGTKTKFLGWVPHDHILSYMGVAEVFIMPSDEEGFPHVLLEAMALGVPFVATDVGGVSEIVPPSIKKTLIPKGDMRAFSARLAALLSLSDSEREVLILEMAEWVGRYDSRVVAKRFIEIIETP